MEGHPHMYIRQEVSVRTIRDLTDHPMDNEEEVTCNVYMLKRFKPELLNLPCHSRYQPEAEKKLVYQDDGGVQNLEDVLKKEIWTET